MVRFESTVKTDGIDRFVARLVPELMAGVDSATSKLQPIAEDNVEEMGAVDTYALKNSFYVSTLTKSTYLEAVAQAVTAYQSNPTKFPEIREANGGILDVDPEAAPQYANRRIEGVLGVAAAHGKAVEEGYVSFYGNDVEPRPFMQQTAEDGFPMVVDEVRRAIARALT